MMPDIKITIPPHIINQMKQDGHGIITEYHVSDDICVLFKSRDLVVIKKNEPNAGKKKKVVSWHKKDPDVINAELAIKIWE